MADAIDDGAPGHQGPGDSSGGGSADTQAGHGDPPKADDRVVDSVFAHSRLWSQLVLLAGLAVLVFASVLEMAGYPDKGRQFPLITFVAIAVLIVVRAVNLVVVARRTGQPAPDRQRLRKELDIVGWLGLLGVALVLLGLIPGAILFLAAYLAVHRPVKLWACALVVLVTWLAIQGLFVVLLDLPFRPGMLFR